MIDNIKVLLDAHVPAIAQQSKEVFYYRDLLFVPGYNKSLGVIQYWDAKLKNLIIRLVPHRNHYFVINSIHKFSKGNNYSDFHLSEVKEIVTELSDILGEDVAKGSIKQIEYGCNIILPDTQPVMEGLVSYKGRQFNPMLSKGKKYGARCDLSQHLLKAYDKSVQVKQVENKIIEPGLFRWESSVRNMQHLHKRKIPIYQVEDLINYESAQLLCDDLVQKFILTKKNKDLKTAGLSLREKTAVARLSNPTVKADIMQNQTFTYREDVRLVNRLTIRERKQGVDEVSDLLAQKCKQLING